VIDPPRGLNQHEIPSFERKRCCYDDSPCARLGLAALALAALPAAAHGPGAPSGASFQGLSPIGGTGDSRPVETFDENHFRKQWRWRS
jgi:hypothetical protein